jgi:dGTPase
MDCADEIAYAVHDLEDAIALDLIKKESFSEAVHQANTDDLPTELRDHFFTADSLNALFSSKGTLRKNAVGSLVHFLVISVAVDVVAGFEHPLLKNRAIFSDNGRKLVHWLKALVDQLVVQQPPIQHLERRSERALRDIFSELMSCPEKLVPSWECYNEDDTKMRRVCDFMAGMTDRYAEALYNRLFTPGFGTSRDRL